MAKIRLGFISLESNQVSFYPQWLRNLRGQPGGDLLQFYAERLSTIEITSINYSIPSPSVTQRWADGVPSGFTFHVKLFGLFTFGACKRSALPPSAQSRLKTRGDTVRLANLAPDVFEEVWRCFLAALAPLRERSKLGAVVAQFTPAFRPCDASFARLREISTRIAPSPLAAEFRSPEWRRSREALRCLDELGILCVATDDNGSHNQNNNFQQLPSLLSGRSMGYCRIHRRPTSRATGLVCEDVTAEDIEASSEVDPITGLCSGDLTPAEVSSWGGLLAAAAVEAASGAQIFVMISTVGHNASADNVCRLREELGPALVDPWPLPLPCEHVSAERAGGESARRRWGGVTGKAAELAGQHQEETSTQLVEEVEEANPPGQRSSRWKRGSA